MKTAVSIRTLTLTNGKNEAEVGAVGMSKPGIGISDLSDRILNKIRIIAFIGSINDYEVS